MVEFQEYWVWNNSPIGSVIIYNNRVGRITIDDNYRDPAREWLLTTIQPVDVSSNQAGMVFIATPNGIATSGGQSHATQRVPLNN
jgi:hypothetical protein